MLKLSRHFIWFMLMPMLCIGVAFGGLSIYAGGHKLPSGLTLSGWKIGGYAFERFDKEYGEQVKRMKLQAVVLTSTEDGIPKGVVSLEQLGIGFNSTEFQFELHKMRSGTLIERARTRWKLRGSALDLNVTLDPKVLAQTVQTTWKTLYQHEPISAKRIITPTDQVAYENETSVYRVDLERLSTRLLEAAPPIGSFTETMQPIRLELPLLRQPAKVTVKSLRSEGIERKIGEFTTYFPSQGAGRIYNIQSTAASIHDLVLKPDEIFDYSRVIRQTETKYGYKEAPVILNGKLVPGIGGGICQVSTTLYNAVLRSGLAIVERRNHSLPISYVPLGQDATFSNGYINFKFQNNTETHLLIRTLTTNDHITVKLFGSMPGDITYDIESKITKTLPPSVKYIHNPMLQIGSQIKLMDGKPGYVVETYRYKKQNGTVTSTEKISRDTYSPQPTLIESNSGETPKSNDDSTPPGENIVEDGVMGPVFPNSFEVVKRP